MNSDEKKVAFDYIDRLRYQFCHSEWLRKLGLHETRFIIYNDANDPKMYDGIDWLRYYLNKAI